MKQKILFEHKERNVFVLKESSDMTLWNKGQQTDVVDTSGDYKLHINAVDGPGVKSFSNLEDVARYLKGRDLGPEYRREGGLQAEYAQYAFDGFTWEDIMDGNPQSYEAKYKNYLLDLPLKLRWKHEKIKDSTVYSDVWQGYQGGDSGYDYSAQIYLDKPYEGRERFYHIIAGGQNGKWLPKEKTLEDAQKAAIKGIPEYEEELRRKYGPR
jgi:hypothetical protein